jgi:HK97 family phage major capsid protein
MGLVVGTGGSAVWMPDAHGAPQMTLLGRPIVISEKVPGAVGTRGDISLVDFGYYLIGDGMRMRIESSTDYRFGNDQTSYRLVQRNDGRPWMTTPVTPRNNSATLASAVQLSSTRT